jgi:hypothetical protein
MSSPSRSDSTAPRSLELFGPSSGGKSTLVSRFLAGRCAMRVVLHTDRILSAFFLGWLPGWLLRTMALDTIALGAVVATWPLHGRCYRLAAAQALRGRGPRSLYERGMLLRNAWKGVALCVLAERLARPGEVLLLDEGSLQTANYLFVHADVPPSREALEAYLAVLPLPGAALFLRANEDELVERTLARGHARVPDGSREATRRFVRHTLDVLDRVAIEPRVAARLIDLDELLGPKRATEACA